MTLLTALGVMAARIEAGSAAASLPSALSACASIAADAERLACYDRLARRTPQTATAQPPEPSPRELAPDTAAARPPPPASTPAAPASPPAHSFGLYEAEHPKAAPAATAASLAARVIALDRSANGRMRLSLEGGAVWELDEADPLLAPGDTVTITRAALGSFMLHTPTKRNYRVHRLR